MKVSRCQSRSRPPQAGSLRSAESGSAVLIVLILLSLMVTLVVNQSLALHHLKQELQLIEHRQLQWPGAVTRTNTPATKPDGQARPRTQ